LFLNLKGEQWTGNWIINRDNTSEVRQVDSNKSNLLDVDPPILFDIEPGDVEIIYGAIKALKKGVYTVLFSCDYRFLGDEGRNVRTQPVRIVKY
jgi:hypothetical protein